MKKIIPLLLFSFRLFGTDLATSENVPSSLIEGCVSAITGELSIIDQDIAIYGAETIPFKHSYEAGVSTEITHEITTYPDSYVEHAYTAKYHIFSGWNFFKTSFLKNQNNTIEEKRFDGSYLNYEINKKHHDKTKGVYKYATLPSTIPGITNTATGILSGQTSIPHQYITKEKNTMTVHYPDGREALYTKTDANSYAITQEKLPNGNYLFYTRENEDSDKLLRITAAPDITQSKTYSSVTYDYQKKENGEIKSIQTSDNQVLKYTFHDNNLSEIDSSFYPKQTFKYGDYNLLYKISRPNERYLKFEYENIFEETPFFPKIKAIYAPKGAPGKENCCIYTFYYDCYRRNTDVYDVYDNRTRYYYDKDNRLTSIEKYRKQNNDPTFWNIVLFNTSNQILCNTATFTWGEEEDRGRLIKKEITDGQNNLLSSTTYFYDTFGNVIQEHLDTTKPSNKCSEKSFWDGIQIIIVHGDGPFPTKVIPKRPPFTPNDTTFTKTRTYSNDGKNSLLTSTEEEGPTIHYTYLKGTNLPLSEITQNGEKILKRKYYTYDENRILIKTTIDDGTSANEKDLTNVTTRLIESITPSTIYPYCGCPATIENKYWDGKEEKLLTKQNICYGVGGKIYLKDIYDANNVHRYSLHYKHDSKGNLIEETNAIGQRATYQYDENKNRISKTDFSGLTTTYRYDLSNRLIQTTEHSQEYPPRITTHTYDCKDNRTSTTDYMGRTTRFSFDHFNNLIETFSPPQEAWEGKKISHKTTSTYDDFGREISKTDNNGNTTLFAYNAYNKPTQVTHPDESQEIFTYYKNGKLKTHINTEKVELHFVYDILGRPTTKTTRFKEEVLKEEIIEYKGMQIATQIDADGVKTTYEYDGAGRKISETKGGETTNYSYDEWGNLQTSCKGNVITTVEYDLLKRKTKTSETTLDGQLLSTIETSYDKGGNTASTTEYIQGERSTTTHEYDSFNRLIKTTNPVGAIITTEYQDTKSIKITTAPNGLRWEQLYNFAGSLIDEKKYAANGNLLYDEHYYFDGMQNPIFRKSQNPNTITKKTYNNRNRLETVTEGYNTPKEKTTRLYYSPEGNLQEVHKPSGVVLHTTYDPLQRKIREFSSDGTLDHSFSYNKTGKIVQAIDHVHNQTTTRTISPLGYTLKETLGNNLSISYTYNNAGQRTSCLLPDNTTIDYTYHGKHLHTVSRNGYTHYFLQYDLSGHILLEKGIDGSPITHTYTPTGRHESITTPHYHQKIHKFDISDNVLSLETNNSHQNFSYDPIGNLIEEPENRYTYDSHASCVEHNGNPLLTNEHHEYFHTPYDQDGNPLESNNVQYTYDAIGRLIRAEDNTFTATYIYDPFNRRLSKTIKTPNTDDETHKIYLYDGYNEIGQGAEDGTLEELRILGRYPQSEAGASLFLELKEPGTTSTYIPTHDLFKNITALVDVTGDLVEQNTYSPFQEETKDQTTSNPWRFASKRIDPETSLILFGRRYYDPTSRRWLTPDPTPDHINPYLFANNNPLSFTDKYGYTAIPNHLLGTAPLPPACPIPIDYIGNYGCPDICNQDCYIPEFHTGLYTFHSTATGETHPRIFFSNGINTSFVEASQHASRISNLTRNSRSIGIFYQSTNGALKDGWNAWRDVKRKHMNACGRFMADHINTICSSSSGEFLFLLHSRAAITFRNALPYIPLKNRMRLNAILIAPAAYISDKWGCRRAIHLISRRDYYATKIFPRLPGNEQLRESAHDPSVIHLGPHPNTNGFWKIDLFPTADHRFSSPIYQQELQGYIGIFENTLKEGEE